MVFTPPQFVGEPFGYGPIRLSILLRRRGAAASGGLVSTARRACRALSVSPVQIVPAGADLLDDVPVQRLGVDADALDEAFGHAVADSSIPQRGL